MSKTQKKKKSVAGTLIKESSIESVSTRPPADADAVAARAYELFVARGCVDGHALEDWIEAEKQLSNQLSIQKCNQNNPLKASTPRA